MSKANKAEELAHEYSKLRVESMGDVWDKETISHESFNGYMVGWESRQPEIDEINKSFDSFKQAMIRADNLNSDLVWEGENEKPLRVQLEEKISDLTKEVERLRKEIEKSKGIRYEAGYIDGINSKNK